MVTTFKPVKNKIRSFEEQGILFQEYILKQKTNDVLYCRNQNQFAVKVDRLFICVRDGEQAITFLEQIGLKSHPSTIRSTSQGTLSKIFFFKNLYLEIVWLEKNVNQNREELTTVINFKTKTNWQQNQVSPVGIGIASDYNNQSFLLDSSMINDLILDDLFCCFQQNRKNSLEPFIFLIPEFLIIQQSLQKNINLKLEEHPLGVTDITNIKINLLKGRRRSSNILKMVNNSNMLQLEYSQNPLIEITLDRGIRKQVLDARPILPLIIKY